MTPAQHRRQTAWSADRSTPGRAECKPRRGPTSRARSDSPGRARRRERSVGVGGAVDNARRRGACGDRRSPQRFLVALVDQPTAVRHRADRRDRNELCEHTIVSRARGSVPCASVVFPAVARRACGARTRVNGTIGAALPLSGVVRIRL